MRAAAGARPLVDPAGSREGCRVMILSGGSGDGCVAEARWRPGSAAEQGQSGHSQGVVNLHFSLCVVEVEVR